MESLCSKKEYVDEEDDDEEDDEELELSDVFVSLLLSVSVLS